MLNWFPTPYPEEWWYSVLCRYYVRTGIKEQETVKKMLFEGTKGGNIGRIFPNKTIWLVVKQLPPELFDIRDIILKHTTFQYFTRLNTLPDKDELLRQLCTGEVFQLTYLWKSQSREDWAPRYCPVCVEEDTAAFGEAYWHTDHQIPAMRVCTRHHCRLRQVDIPNATRMINNCFYPLSGVKKETEADYDFEPWEETVSRHVRAYWNLPYSVGPTSSHNNLIQGLKNAGYCTIGRTWHATSVNRDKVYLDMGTAFDLAVVQDAFGQRFSADMEKRIERWEHLVPDRYILLQTLVGMPTQTVFDLEPLEDRLKTKILQVASEQRFVTFTQAARELGLKRYELSTLVDMYGLEPFWTKPLNQKTKEVRKAFIRFTLDEDELKEITEFSKNMGYRCVGHFALQCIQYVMKQEGFECKERKCQLRR